MTHSPNAGYEAGNHWVECPRCGNDVRANEMKKEWTGQYVCVTYKCYEVRHPQDFVRAREEKVAPKEPVYPPPEVRTTGVEFDDIGLNVVPSGTFNNNL